jgi:putative lipase involved disintegration of autophagic bodies
VTGKSATECAPNVTLTGHSLGGGLAGFINVTTGTKAVVFDNLPFDVSGMVRAGRDEVWAEGAG